MAFGSFFVLVTFVYWICLVGNCVLCYNGRACTVDVCHVNDASLRFFVIGDWGGQDAPPYFTPAQKTVAQAMDKMGEEKQAHFTVSVGDNLYNFGAKRADSSRFETTFNQIYKYGKALQMPWYMTAGNHDYFGDINAQLLYSKLNPRWIYPDLSYVVRYNLTETGTTVDLIFIDTVILCGVVFPGGRDPQTGQYDSAYAYDPPKGPRYPEKAAAMWTWLEQELSENKANYLFIVGHYPAFSGGKHGMQVCPRPRLHSLMEQYYVNGYLTGHDHNLQYLETTSATGWTVQHILSGGGNSLKFFYPAPNQHRMPNSANVGGFVYVDLRYNKGVVTYLNGLGQTLYQVETTPRPPILRTKQTNGYTFNTTGGQRRRHLPKIMCKMCAFVICKSALCKQC